MYVYQANKKSSCSLAISKVEILLAAQMGLYSFDIEFKQEYNLFIEVNYIPAKFAARLPSKIYFVWEMRENSRIKFFQYLKVLKKLPCGNR